MKYSKETIRKINADFLSFPGSEITQAALEKIERFSEFILAGIEAKKPKIGDMVRVRYKNGEIYYRAHIRGIEGDVATLCLFPRIPTVKEVDGGISFEVNGGPWRQVSIKDFEYCSQDKKFFKTLGFGNSAYCNSIRFPVEVNQWECKKVLQAISNQRAN